MRERHPLIDRLIRTYARYQADRGDQLAAAVTFYWFLSLFPILLLVLAGYGYLHANENISQLDGRLSGDLQGFLPQNLIDAITKTLASAKGRAGVLGLVGLLLSGLGWIDSLREAIRRLWHLELKAGNVITRRVADVVVLIGLFATIAASSFAAGLASSGPRFVLSQLGVDKTTAAALLLKLLAYLVAGAVDVVLFLYLFKGLARVPCSLRELRGGAVFGAVGFAVLKAVGGFYVQHTTTKGQATYGTFAVVVGLLLFLNLVSRLLLLATAFAVTGRPEPEQPAGSRPLERPVERPALPPVPVKGEASVRLAARATMALVGLAVASVAVYGARTIRGLGGSS